MARLTINQKEYEVERGSNLLEVCLANGVYVPHLCHWPGLEPPPASCRLCFVEIEGQAGPIPACSVKVKDGMKVTTDAPEARRLQRSALNLLLSVHNLDCKNCPANKKCELQRLARFLGLPLKPRPFPRRPAARAIEEEHPCLNYDYSRCVLCGRCLQVCQSRRNQPYLTLANRGFETYISFFGAGEQSGQDCRDCRACAETCPTGALSLK
ncbi:MAG: 2Fe-2S iron-sulfur cluster-binding protein [Thermodesulfobacteriota bacterium]